MDEMQVKKINLTELDDRNASDAVPLMSGDWSLVKDVRVELSVRLGDTTMTIGELFSMGEGTVLSLDREIDMPVDVLLNGRVVARGQLVAAGDNFGVSVTEVLSRPGAV